MTNPTITNGITAYESHTCDTCGAVFVVRYNLIQRIFRPKNIEACLADNHLAYCIHNTNHVLDNIREKVYGQSQAS